MNGKHAAEVVNIGPVRFPKPVADEIDALADRLGHTRSSLVRVAVRRFLAEQVQK